MNQKALFVNIEINIWLPIDPYLVTYEFKLQDLIEDEIEKLEKVSYEVQPYLVQS